ncbi:hypothetical protein [Methanosarcina barkeri]|uniref:hypothetical protein n=1 Tax=Methanosarcina barkeri TaxID=2208 RepID=UPI000053E655|nr:hypothetical protein [Methanosarcina barkeri]
MIEIFVSYILGELNRALDAQMKEEEQEEFVKSTVKEALLGCYIDWKTFSEFIRPEKADAKLKRYAEMLNTVSVKFRSSGMMSLSLCECIWGFSHEMATIIRYVELNNYGDPYIKKTDELFAKIYSTYENFDKLYDSTRFSYSNTISS